MVDLIYLNGFKKRFVRNPHMVNFRSENGFIFVYTIGQILANFSHIYKNDSLWETDYSHI